VKVGFIGTEEGKVTVEAEKADLTVEGAAYVSSTMNSLKLTTGVMTAYDIRLKLSRDLREAELELKGEF